MVRNPLDYPKDLLSKVLIGTTEKEGCRRKIESESLLYSKKARFKGLQSAAMVPPCLAPLLSMDQWLHQVGAGDIKTSANSHKQQAGLSIRCYKLTHCERAACSLPSPSDRDPIGTSASETTAPTGLQEAGSSLDHHLLSHTRAARLHNAAWLYGVNRVNLGSLNFSRGWRNVTNFGIFQS
jgi:hypothetical protein